MDRRHEACVWVSAPKGRGGEGIDADEGDIVDGRKPFVVLGEGT